MNCGNEDRPGRADGWIEMESGTASLPKRWATHGAISILTLHLNLAQY
jgi:hypothetical protein